ncbi:MAG: iron-sulfur cluster assembly protein [Myxococcota bacterium]|jgi:iron-sulfur cluster assembly protein
MAVTLTTAAAQRVQELLPSHPGADWLRLGIRGGGCSGLSYFMDFVPTPSEKDKTFDLAGVQVCVDRKSYLYLNGTEIDWEESLIAQRFVFNNPQAKRSCSCGESFTL